MTLVPNTYVHFLQGVKVLITFEPKIEEAEVKDHFHTVLAREFEENFNNLQTELEAINKILEISVRIGSQKQKIKIKSLNYSTEEVQETRTCFYNGLHYLCSCIYRRRRLKSGSHPYLK